MPPPLWEMGGRGAYLVPPLVKTLPQRARKGRRGESVVSVREPSPLSSGVRLVDGPCCGAPGRVPSAKRLY